MTSTTVVSVTDNPRSGLHTKIVVKWDRRPACQKCGSRNTVVTSTRADHRYHQCRDCGANFVSL